MVGAALSDAGARCASGAAQSVKRAGEGKRGRGGARPALGECAAARAWNRV